MNTPTIWITEKALEALQIPAFSQVTHMLAVKPSQVDTFNVPLYTHPVKELTDEEIEEVFWGIANQKIDTPVLSFAKAILRKAQEK